MLGYCLFAAHLWRTDIRIIDTLLAFYFLAGGIFIMLVVKMSIASMNNAKRIASVERHNATHDELTSLPNRGLLHTRIEHALTHAKQTDGQVAVLLLDLDRFKEINDTLGHHTGDLVLQQIAPRLRETARDSDTVARLGGDEFCIIMPATDLNAAGILSERIIETMQHPIQVHQHTLKVGASIGISHYPRHAKDTDTLLRHADVAMYTAKRKNTGYAVYDAENDKYSLRRLQLTNELEDAIKHDRLELHYQPIISINDIQILHIEALARWPRSNIEVVLPDDFIPIAERSGLIHKLTRWVLNKATRQLSEWGGLGITCRISINISSSDLQQPGFVEEVKELLSKRRVTADRLIFEITESSMMRDYEQTHTVLNKLHNLGITLAIDDFGTGYSSLAHLKHLPTNLIKIDQSFVVDMTEDENDAVIVRSTIDLAHNMGKKVVAEGVHSREVMDILEILGCDMAQGFHIARPMPASELPAWLSALKENRIDLRTRPVRRAEDNLQPARLKNS